jgi:hypothetical protein
MMGSGDSPAADPEQVLALQVMAPFHLGVEKAILGHRYGKAAKLLFSYLQALTKMGRTQAGWVPVPQRVADALGLSRQSRIRGLRALEHLGLVELEQSGRRTDRACLCHCAPATRAIAGAPAKLAGARRHKGAHRRVG